MLLTLFNCNKNTTEISPANQDQLAPGVTASEDYVSFVSIDAYENFFAEGNDSARVALLMAVEKNQTHTSMMRAAQLRTSTNTSIVDSLYPEFLQTILNPDGITQIGNYLIKVDMANEKVLVLNVADKDFYEDLVSNNFSNTKILVYSTNDEVLDMLANGIPPSQSPDSSSANLRETLFCNQKAAEGREDKSVEEYMSGWRFDSKAVYQSAGIYFSLIAKANKQTKVVGLWIESTDGFDMSMDYYYTYTPKCRDTSTGSNTITTGGTTVAFRPYESTTALKNFYYAARFKNSSGFVSRVYQIGY